MSGKKGHFQLCTDVSATKGKVRSLQDLCRGEVIRRVTLQRMQQVGGLPLPTLLRDYITTFNIPDDFDLEGLYMDYNFNFPNHVHHQTHQIHPGRCTLDGSKVLIKSQKLSPCACCDITGSHTLLHEDEREKWARLRHPNIMNCLFRLSDPDTKLVCYVLEFPIITLQDLAFRLQFFGQHVPEFLVWQTIHKLSQTFDYLMSVKVNPIALCQPQHIAIDCNGEVKVENLLLYLPEKCGSHYRTTVVQSNLASLYTPPEEMMGFQSTTERTIAWSLGCILYELTAYMPTCKGEEENQAPLIFPACTPATPAIHRYSPALLRLTAACLSEDPSRRLPLRMIQIASGTAVQKLQEQYKGPTNLLQLLPPITPPC